MSEREENGVPSKFLEIDKLLPANSPRTSGENENHVRLLAEAGTDVPPILVHRQTMRVIDGMHRLHAARMRGDDVIAAEFFDGSEEAAFVRAVEANITHGLPLSLEDRRAAAARIIGMFPDMADRSIARSAGLAPGTVSRIRQQMTEGRTPDETRLGRDGRRRPVNGADARKRAADAIMADPTAPLRRIAEIAGVSIGTAHSVRKGLWRRNDVDRPSPDGNATANFRPQARTGHRSHSPERQDSQSRLLVMQKDPALKFSELGKELLRWLHVQSVAEAKISRMTEVIPSHLLPIVADMALHSAETWNDFAEALKERWRHQSDGL
ncbi:hypothetical protein [Actinomadura chokoriensis]|uniref:ParB/RepB/Spo0J family partition protein n=1 Tax=Actinomadura chokoriensis TaxID=454156 RepID=A0ABV4QYS2_9ACTN